MVYTHVENGQGRAPLPEALLRKYPNASREWLWQWVFPASTHYVDGRTGLEHRHHVHESVIQKAVHQAAHRARLAKRLTTHGFRHSFATHLETATTSVRCRSCWGTRMWKPR